ncbi:MAG TPA: DUF2306 domain-containing protein [Mycobacteriales bacterium]|nr:DUF2306 domain-containing protein [Mycobacteriales bacterium]
MHRWTLLIALHALGATFSLAVGALILLRRRKGDLAHRRVGRIWMGSMYWTAGSSFGIRALHPGHLSWIHGLSAWTIASLSVALWAARTHRAQLHRNFVVGSYLGLCGAGIAAMAFPVRLVPQLLVHRPLTFFGAAVAVSVVALVVARACGLSSRRASGGDDVRRDRPRVGHPGEDGAGGLDAGRAPAGVLLGAQR